MDLLLSSAPSRLPDMDHQTSASDIDDEEFDRAWKERKFTWYHRLFQVICFIVFLGPFRIVFGVLSCIISMSIIILFRIFLHKIGKPDKYKKFCIRIARFGFRSLFFGFGHLHIRMKGDFDPEARVIISNHTHLIDPFVIVCMRFVTVVMKKEIANHAAYRYICECVDPVYVDRKVSTGASKLIVDHANDPKLDPVLIFPEGTITNGDCMLKFHRSAFLTHHKVQPMTIRYWQPLVPHGWNSYAWTTVSTLEYIWQLLCMPWNIITVEALPPMTLDVDGEGDVEKFALKAQLAMANSLQIKAVTRSSDEIFKAQKAARKEEKERMAKKNQ